MLVTGGFVKSREVPKTKKHIEDVKAQKARKRKNLALLLLTGLLAVFFLQVLFGAAVNSSKLYSLRTKISALEKINKTAKHKNTYLREELEKYNSNTGVEALSRDRLQFSKEDETLVIIKNITQHKEEE